MGQVSGSSLSQAAQTLTRGGRWGSVLSEALWVTGSRKSQTYL